MGGRGKNGSGGGFHGQRGEHRDNSNHLSRDKFKVESNMSDEEGQRDRHAATMTTNGRATVRNIGRTGDSATNYQSIKSACACFDTNVLIALPCIHFSSGHNVPEIVHFTSALRNSDESVRVAGDDTESVPGPEVSITI